MKRITFLSFFSLISLCSITHAAPNSSNAPKVIDAEVVDAGDYYLGLDGQPIRFYRKKDVFLKLDSIKAARQQKHLRAQQSAQNKSASSLQVLTPPLPGFSRIEQHRWGGLEIIQSNKIVSSISANKQSPAQSAPTQPGLAPVFTSESGRGEYLILPDIMISFSSKQDVAAHQQTMLDQFGMHVKNQMMFSDTNFVLAFDTPVTDYSEVFSTTRDLMALPYIEWAEPNMQVKLKKTAIPNDKLFREQWGLYSWGLNGEFCDANVAADIDASDAWDLMDTLSLEPKPVIAIIDDGVHLTHSDLTIWDNPSPGSGIPFSSNRCENDTNGCNFGDFYINGGRVYNNSDMSTVVHPSPQTGDTHGTRAAGIAAATRNNTTGITGSAYDAEILPIRLTGFGFDAIDCVALEDALSYAAKYADVISNSWQMDVGDINNPPTCQSSIDAKLTQINNGNAAFERGTNGTPILFASGNSGTGWQKVSINIPSANSTVQFTFHKDFSFEDFGEDAVWIDDVQLPGVAVENIGASMPSTDWTLSNVGTNNTVGAGSNIYSGCDATASAALPVPAAGNHAMGGTGHAIKLDGVSATGEDCQYLEIVNVDAGTLTFWVWVSAETWDKNGASGIVGELFRTYVNGDKTGIDLITRSTQSRGINNEAAVFHDELGYPASHPDVIAVGASNDGKDAQMEDRAYFSQYGPTLDVVAPGTAIRSTTSNGSYGYLSGTSASTPMVAGIIANMLAVDSTLTLTQIKTHLHDSADKIGPDAGEFTYSGGGFNNFYGFGRANSYKAVQLANGTMVGDLIEATEICEDPNPGAADDDFLLLMMPAILAGAKKNKN